MGNKKVLYVILAVICLSLTACAGAGVMYSLMSANRSELNSSSIDGNKLQLKNETSIAKVASDVAPSVVSITTKSGAGLSSKQGAGTGIVVSEDGYVITNKHVIKNASDIAVTTSDGLIFDNIKTIGEDPLNDVAFLKINGAKKLKPAKLGNSSTLQIGQNVVAIGNTLGLYQNTVTSGIVSGLGRPAASSQSGGSAESLNDLIQTDTAINPGNSGGPLVNLAGQVIGINTAIVSNAQGIGFAIPIDVVKGMLEGVLKKGKLERAYLGVRYGEITPVIAKQRNLSTNRGALVAEDGVESGGPADKAGIKPGDIITKVGDLVVGEKGNVSSLISRYKPGDNVDIVALRNGKQINFKVRLGVLKSGAKLNNLQSDDESKELDSDSDSSNKGMSLEDLFGF
jgi:peptidase Do